MVLPASSQAHIFIPQARIADPTSYQEYFGEDGEYMSNLITWDSPKGGGVEFPPIKTKPNAESNWNENEWVHNRHKGPQQQQYNKKKSQKLFLLNNDDMADLCYMKISISGRPRTHVEHCYLMEDVERRAWEKYGGPQGLAAARKLDSEKKKAKRDKTAGTSSPKKGSKPEALHQ